MSEKLLAQRVELAKAYATANDAVQVANAECAAASNAVVAFDAKHPEIMEAVKLDTNSRKRAVRDELKAEREADLAEGGEE